MTQTFIANYLQLQIFAECATRSNMDVEQWVLTSEFNNVTTTFRKWYETQSEFDYKGIDTLSNKSILVKYLDSYGIKHTVRF